jgi:hypothetical protein
MNIQHDKHQYFFEKFLRNEMKPEEAKLFKLRLENDLAFREDFEFYFRNRQTILEDGLAEYDEPELLIKKPERWGWLYAAISILCIVLIVDYFLSVKYNQKLNSSKQRTTLIERFNIFKGKRPIHTPNNSVLTINRDSIILANKTVKTNLDNKLNPSVEGEMIPYLEDDHDAIKGDYFVSDTLFGVIEKEEVDSKLGKLRVQTDSLFVDSLLEVLAIKEILKSEIPLKRQLLVEFWDSELHFRGYIFDGKKLLLYDLDKLLGLVLTYDEQGKVYHLYINFREYHLFNDGKLHKLGE